MKSNSYCFNLWKQTSMDIGSKGAEGTLMQVFCYSYFHEVCVYLRQIQVWEINYMSISYFFFLCSMPFFRCKPSLTKSDNNNNTGLVWLKSPKYMYMFYWCSSIYHCRQSKKRAVRGGLELLSNFYYYYFILKGLVKRENPEINQSYYLANLQSNNPTANLLAKILSHELAK